MRERALSPLNCVGEHKIVFSVGLAIIYSLLTLRAELKSVIYMLFFPGSLAFYGGWSLTGHQVLTKATLFVTPPRAGMGTENTTQVLWVKMTTGRHHSPGTITGKTDLIWGKLI